MKDNGQLPRYHISHLFFVDDLLLFGEAAEKQARVMQQVLEIFYKESREKMNLEKSKV